MDLQQSVRATSHALAKAQRAQQQSMANIAALGGLTHHDENALLKLRRARAGAVASCDALEAAIESMDETRAKLTRMRRFLPILRKVVPRFEAVLAEGLEASRSVESLRALVTVMRAPGWFADVDDAIKLAEDLAVERVLARAAQLAKAEPRPTAEGFVAMLDRLGAYARAHDIKLPA
jgi:hypothetical protein